MSRILLATSIAPVKLENQKIAIQSWIDSGFEVISCNVAEEIEVLQEKFPQVEFVELARSGKETVGKPCPYIYDIMQVLRKRENEICGIINSDIHMRHFTPDITEYVKEKARESIVYFHRHEVESLQAVEECDFRIFVQGVDLFIFSKTQIDVFEDLGMMIGQSTWDYWLPITAREKGVPVSGIMNPVLFHISHPVQWSNEIAKYFCMAVCNRFFPDIPEDKAVRFVSEQYLKLISLESTLCCCPVQRNTSGQYRIHNPYQEEQLLVYPVFSEVATWIMETYQLRELRVSGYFFVNRETGSLSMENYNEALLETQWAKWEPIRISYTGGDERSRVATTTIGLIGWLYRKDYVEDLKRNQVIGNIFVCPAGQMARVWAESYEEHVQILGFLDNRLKETHICGKAVYAPETLKYRKDYDKVIIVTNFYGQELYEQLQQYCEKDKIVVWRDFPEEKE